MSARAMRREAERRERKALRRAGGRILYHGVRRGDDRCDLYSAPMPHDEFTRLTTPEEIQQFVAEAYARRAGGPLTPAVAEPGRLIEHAVRLAGAAGLTLQEAEATFDRLGRERYLCGLAVARASRRINEQHEMRPNCAGRLQRQVVLYDALYEPTISLFAS